MRIPRLSRIPRFLLACAALYIAASCAGCALVNAAMFHPPSPPYGTDPPWRGPHPATAKQVVNRWNDLPAKCVYRG